MNQGTHPAYLCQVKDEGCGIVGLASPSFRVQLYNKE